MVALTYIVSGKPDGYNLAYVTKSNIAQFANPKAKLKIDDLDWLAMLVSDPESLIVRKNSPIRTLDQIVADAKAKKGGQIWVGPAAGGNDHIMAMKTWKALGIQAKWVPFESGDEAMVALMGGHGAVYVGNPGDVTGKPDLENAVIASPKRLEGEPWSKIPTFKELGVKGLDEELMWRGFAITKGIPEEARKFYVDLITKVSNDPQWRKYIEDEGADSGLLQRRKIQGTRHPGPQGFRRGPQDAAHQINRWCGAPRGKRVEDALRSSVKRSGGEWRCGLSNISAKG